MRFQPSKNWMNDPNGPIFYDGVWHLFYQHNPNGDQWGDIGWGHATSADLIHWQERPLAIAADEEHLIFSGSVIHDSGNESGLGTNSSGPLIAFYTGHTRAEPQRQVQCVAYSNDGGEQWSKYEANPIIDLQLANFRDPKVFWHAATRKWIMLTVLASERAVLFYSSENLLNWTSFHRFDAPHAGPDEWECPDLVELPVKNGGPGDTRWVLFVSVGGGAPSGGVGVQYFVGDFDGSEFRLDDDHEDRWVDYGPDFYAPQSFSGVETTERGGIWLGWMNNWIYAKNTLAQPSRGMMSLARIITLLQEGDQYDLIQQPIIPDLLDQGDSFTLRAGECAKLEFSSAAGEHARVEIDLVSGAVHLDRIDLSASLPENFKRSYEMHWSPEPSETATIVFDDKGIEIFAANGRRVFTALFQFESTSVAHRRLDGAVIEREQGA